MAIAGMALGQLLIEEGLCPAKAINIELHIPASGMAFIRYDVAVEPSDYTALARVMERAAQLKKRTS